MTLIKINKLALLYILILNIDDATIRGFEARKKSYATFSFKYISKMFFRLCKLNIENIKNYAVLIIRK